MKKPELLAPAGDIECFYAAIQAGCDAVYMGGIHFGARAYSKNFSDEEIIEAINYAHLYGVKVYVTVNTMITEMLVKPFLKYVDFLHRNNVDGIIISDIGMIDYLRKTYPNLELHASTQMNIHNLEGTKFLKDIGLKRVVLARELDINKIEEIKNSTDIELEVFVHGALCISYSGECLMSSLIGGRSGNKGTCAQCCRMKYNFMHDGNIINKDKYLLSTKDLNTLENVGKLIDIGVDSLKIEGRMKSKEYVYLVTSLYRKAIDSYISSGHVNITDDEIKDLKKTFNRHYTKGFLMNESNNNFINPVRPNHIGVEIGKVISEKDGVALIKLNDTLKINDGIRIICSEEDVGLQVYQMKKNNQNVEEAYNTDTIEIKVNKKVDVGALVVKTKDDKLNSLINQKIKESNRKVLIKGSIICKLDENIIFKITDSVNEVEIVSDFKVEKAINIPTTKEDIKKQLEKLGDTVYKFNNLEIISDDNIFINVKNINEIRRQAILELNQKRLYKIPYKKMNYDIDVQEFNEDAGYTFYIHDINSYYDIKDKAKEIIVDDVELFNELVIDPKVTLKIPRVISKYDDYNVRVLIGEYGSINKYQDKISDYGFNIANSYAVAFLHSNNVKRVTLSLELNDNEIKKLVEEYKKRYNKKPNLEVVAKALPESMITKFNLIKYFNVPNDNNYLIDKYKNKFKVLSKDNLMYIYHYKKIELDNHKELFNLGINRLRIEVD